MIFGTLAPQYWGAGFSAIPLHPRTKRPAIDGWQVYATESIPDNLREQWLQSFPEHNLGVVLGPQSDLCIIDIDTDNPLIVSAIRAVLPPSPWERRGRKGMALAYRFSNFSTFRLVGANREMLVECLSTRTQCVMPGSVHPDTGQPYIATSDLFAPETLAALMPLPPDAEKVLRGALEFAGVGLAMTGHAKMIEYVSAGGRDVGMVRQAGMHAAAILRGEESFKEAAEHLLAWNESQVEQVTGDPLDINKGITRIAEFLIRDVTGTRRRMLPRGWDAGLTPQEKTDYGFDVFTEEDREWTPDELKTYWRGQLARHEPGTQGRREAVNYVVARLAGGQQVDPLDEDGLLHFMSKTNSFNMSYAALKTAVATQRQAGINGTDHTQIAKALRAELEAVGDVRYWEGSFWQWGGSHWTPLSEGTLRRHVQDSFGHLPLAKRASDHTAIAKVLADQLMRPLADEPTIGVNFANGFLTSDLVLHLHHPKFGAAYTLPYRYVPEGADSAKRFHRFLDSVWGHDADFTDKVHMLRAAMAATLFGIAWKFETAFCCIGVHRSGKSQLLNLVEGLMPAGTISSINPDQWHDKFLPAEMVGKLINICSELPDKRHLDGRMFKTIVSGEFISAQRKNRDPFRFRPTCAHWIGTNHIPRTLDTSGGFIRRWRMFTFTRQVPADQTILGIGRDIAAEEREAIAAWAVQAITAIMERGTMPICASHALKSEEMAARNNSVHQFVRSSGEVFVGTAILNSPTPIPERALYNAYYSFQSVEGGARAVPLDTFREQMSELGSALGFQVSRRVSDAGMIYYEYENITLAKKSAGALRKLSGTG